MTYICVSVFQVCFLTFASYNCLICKHQLKCGQNTFNLSRLEAIETLSVMKQVYKCKRITSLKGG